MAILHIMPTDNELFVVALVLIMLGLVGVGISRRTSDLGKLDKLGHELPIAINANEPSDDPLDDPSTSLSSGSSSTPPEMLARPLLEGEGGEQGEDKDMVDAAETPAVERMSEGRRWCLVALGTSGVSVGFVTIRLCENLSGGITGSRFTWSFGIGLLASAVFVPPLFYFRYRRRLAWSFGIGLL